MLQQKKTPVSHITLDLHLSVTPGKKRHAPSHKRTSKDHQKPWQDFLLTKEYFNADEEKSYPPRAGLHNTHLPSLLSALSKTTGEFHSFLLPFCSSADPLTTFTHLYCSLKACESHEVAFISTSYWRTSCKEKCAGENTLFLPLSLSSPQSPCCWQTWGQAKALAVPTRGKHLCSQVSVSPTL